MQKNQQRQPINIGQFTCLPSNVIGKGATGEVCQGYNNTTKNMIAIKVVKLQQVNTDRKRQLLDREIQALKNIHHNNIIPIYNIIQDHQKLYIPMEYCTNGTLRSYIKSKMQLECLSEKQALKIFTKIVEAYCQIVRTGFVHRDLKTQNILLRKNMEPVIIDFGYCQYASKIENIKLTYNVGSPAYMSPQAYNQNLYCEKSDIWALGVILHEMMTGTIPKMWTRDVNKYFKQLGKRKIADIVPAHQSQFCMSLLVKMLTVDPNGRPSSEKLKSMVNQKNISSPTLRNTTPQIQPQRKRITSMTNIQVSPIATPKTINTNYRNPNLTINATQKKSVRQFNAYNQNIQQPENIPDPIPSPMKKTMRHKIIEDISNVPPLFTTHKISDQVPNMNPNSGKKFQNLRNKVINNDETWNQNTVSDYDVINNGMQSPTRPYNAGGYNKKYLRHTIQPNNLTLHKVNNQNYQNQPHSAMIYPNNTKPKPLMINRTNSYASSSNNNQFLYQNSIADSNDKKFSTKQQDNFYQSPLRRSYQPPKLHKIQSSNQLHMGLRRI